MSCVYISDTLYTAWGDTRTGKMNIYFAKTIASTNTTVGIRVLDGENPPFLIFPNPTKDYINIRVRDEIIEKKVFVVDTKGKRILSQTASKNFSIDISQQPTGMYFLRVNTQNNFYAQKNFKQ